MLHHAVRRFAEVCREIVVVVAPGTPDVPLPGGVPVRVERDATEGTGPLAGVSAGLRTVTTQLSFISGGDMPDVQLRVLLEMLRVMDGSGAAAVALSDRGGMRPLPCLVDTERARAAAEQLLRSGRRSLHDLLQALDVTSIDERTWTKLDPARRTLFDVDVPSDLST